MSTTRAAVVQKLAKRAAQAQRVAERRAERVNRTLRGRDQRQGQRGVVQMTDEVKQNLKDAKIARKEDWELGPLAPKRDLGYNNYGEVTGPRNDWTADRKYKQDPKVIARRTAWAGGVDQFCLAPGDRVVILEGQDKGKIDKIKTVEAKHGFLILENSNQAIQGQAVNDQKQLQLRSYPLSTDAVRLVYPIKNPETGAIRDTMINELVPTAPNMQSPNMSLVRWDHGQKFDRVAPGINTIIPWPEVEAPVHETHKADTSRDLVEDRTFYYDLTTPPLPSGVLNELRNQYSRFRTRHEEWYIEKKEAELIEKQGKHKFADSMSTPLEELHARDKAAKEAMPEPQLTDDMLQKIGQLMAKNKTATLERAGVSEVSKKS